MTTLLQIRKLFKHPVCISLSLWLMTLPAFAHTGQTMTSGWQEGLLHPVLGPDHLSTAMAVAFLALQTRARAPWLYPFSFVSGMAIGAWSGLEGLTLPGVENGILFSVIILGLLVMVRQPIPIGPGCVLLAAFALLHGHAHGSEVPDNADGVTYVTGVLLGTLGLHVTGLCLGRLCMKRFGNSSLQLMGMLLLVYGTT